MVAVKMNVPDPPDAKLAIWGGAGPKRVEVAVPPKTNDDGLILYTVVGEGLDTIIVYVAVPPEKRQEGATVNDAFSAQPIAVEIVTVGDVTILEVFDVPDTVLQLPLVLAQAENLTVPAGDAGATV